MQLGHQQAVLNRTKLTEILEKGHSRIPIYREDRENVVGVLLVKDLVLLNPDDNTPLQTVLGFYGRTLE